MRWIWIDRFAEFESGKRAVAIKNVTLAEEHLHEEAEREADDDLAREEDEARSRHHLDVDWHGNPGKDDSRDQERQHDANADRHRARAEERRRNEQRERQGETTGGG